MTTISKHAQAAKAIRRDLKKEFPETLFSVSSKAFSMGSSASIYWDNGPTTEQVSKIASKYLAGEFNSSNDTYEYTKHDDETPTVKYIHYRRENG